MEDFLLPAVTQSPAWDTQSIHFFKESFQGQVFHAVNDADTIEERSHRVANPLDQRSDYTAFSKGLSVTLLS